MTRRRAGRSTAATTTGATTSLSCSTGWRNGCKSRRRACRRLRRGQYGLPIVEINPGKCYPWNVPGKFRELSELKAVVAEARTKGKKIVFTNGCFDLLHPGHLHLLREAKKLGDLLVVAVNSDSSVRTIKGANRPIVPGAERTELIGALEMVDYVTSFDEPDPYNLVRELKPDVLVKGGDWAASKIVGKELVEENGGKVAFIPLLGKYSTTRMIERMREK